MTWRDRARPIIQRVLRETEGLSDKERRAALRDAYPFGPRAHHPYRVWLDEVRRQLGTKRPKRLGQPDPNQCDMFADRE